MSLLDKIIKKIDENTVTVDDFNELISESTPESVQERIRRRVQKNATDSHINHAGHQKLSLPTLAARVNPKRTPANQQDHGRGKIGRKHSSEKILKKYE